MIKKYLLLTLAAFLLTACGGSGNDKSTFPDSDASIGGGTSNDTGGGTGTDGGTDTGDGSTGDGNPGDGSTGDGNIGGNEENRVIPLLGTGFGDEFYPRMLDVNVENGKSLSEGDAATVSVNLVNYNDANNAITSKDYMVRFSSSCETARFDEQTVREAKNTDGVFSVKYTAKDCSGTDEIDANLIAATGENLDVGASLEVVIDPQPLLGVGSENHFIEKVLSFSVGDEISVGGSTSAEAVVYDKLSGKTISSKRYSFTAESNSDCLSLTPANSEFYAKGLAKVNFKANDSCFSGTEEEKSATVTITLADVTAADGSLIQAKSDITVKRKSLEPMLGTTSSGTFVAGVLDSELTNPTQPEDVSSAGWSATINANIVDLNSSYTNIDRSTYVVKFSSTCSVNQPGRASFDSANVTTTDGNITTTYSAKGCDGLDVITAEMSSLSGEVLGTATTSVYVNAVEKAETPVLGTGSVDNFIAGKLYVEAVDATVNVGSSTTVSAIIFDDLTGELATNRYEVEFTTAAGACLSTNTAKVSARGGQVSAEIEASDACFVGTTDETQTETITANLLDDAGVTLSTATVDVTINRQSLEPMLGTTSSGTFVAGVLDSVLINPTQLEDVSSAGWSATINANIVDLNSNYTNIDRSTYVVKFSSTCSVNQPGRASFDSANVTTTDGNITTTYSAKGCDGLDVITAEMSSLSGEVLGTATTSVYVNAVEKAETPVLGTGSVDNFIAGKLSVAAGTTVNVGTSTTVSAIIFDDLTGELATNRYEVEFTTAAGAGACLSASSGNVSARGGQVSADIEASDACFVGTTDETQTETITANLLDDAGASLSTATVDVTINRQSLEPMLGTITSSGTFVAGVLDSVLINPTQPEDVSSAGWSATINANIVDLNSNYTNIDRSTYVVKFSSTCSVNQPGRASFDNANVTTTDGNITTTYSAKGCSGQDIITAELFSLSGEKLGKQAEAKIYVYPSPALGMGSGNTFAKNKVELVSNEASLGGVVEASVNIVDWASDNNLIQQTVYHVRFSGSACLTPDGASPVGTNTGIASMGYKVASTCSEADLEGTVTAQLVDDSGTPVPNVDQATAKVTITPLELQPVIGVGAGIAFESGLLTTADDISNLQNSGVDINIEASVVNLNVINLGDISEINPSRYQVEFTSTCKDEQPAKASFTPASQIVSDGKVSTKYTAKGCTGLDVISAKLYALDGEDLGSEAKLELNVNPTAKLGSFINDEFKLEELQNNLEAGALLSAGGSTVFSASIVDWSNASTVIDTQEYVVEFAIDDPACGSFSRNEVPTNNGVVNVLFTSTKACAGEKTVTATLQGVVDVNGDPVVATGLVEIQSNVLGGIAFVSTDEFEPAISMSNIANNALPRFTPVTFKVVDKDEQPLIDQKVTFKLVGVDDKEGMPSLAFNELDTNSEGIVVAKVYGGTRHMVTQVEATVVESGVPTDKKTSSASISITTGLPVQGRMSVAAETLNPGAFNKDGVEVKVTATAADIFGNYVPDGTVVNFTAESGTMESTCQTEDGQCTVTWKSGGERPGTPAGPGEKNDRIGMTTIMAYTPGVADFIDLNGNHIFDEGEDFESYDEPFRWDNWVKRTYNSAIHDYFHDTNKDGSYTAKDNDIYQGLCSKSAKDLGHCKDLLDVRAQTRLVQSVRNEVNMTVYTCVNDDLNDTCSEFGGPLDASGGVLFVVLQDTDTHGNIPAFGTVLEVEPDGYKTAGVTGPVPNTLGKLEYSGLSEEYGALYKISYSPEDDPKDIAVNIKYKDEAEAEAGLGGDVFKAP